jgi:hypothetical protein
VSFQSSYFAARPFGPPQYFSISRRWAVAEGALVAFAESVAIVFKRRWRHRWIAEARVTVHIRRFALRNVAAGGLDTIVEPALGNLAEIRRRRRHGVDNRLRVRTTGECKGQGEHSE